MRENTGRTWKTHGVAEYGVAEYQMAEYGVRHVHAAWRSTGRGGIRGMASESVHRGLSWKLSLVAGDTLTLHTSTSAAQYSVEIARLGAERTVVYQKSDVPGGGLHPIPEHASAKGCDWPVSFELPVPAEWESGYYSIVLKVADNGGRFVGRNRRTAETETFVVIRPSALAVGLRSCCSFQRIPTMLTTTGGEQFVCVSWASKPAGP